jgi:hypothetical protein
MSFTNNHDISELNGRHIVSVTGLEPESERVTIECADGSVWTMKHISDCCESVSVVDVVGDVADLQDATVIESRCEENSESHPEGHKPEYCDDSFTWTFYVIQTNKGAVTIRWLGQSNGYYSESIDFELTNPARGDA